MGGETNPATRCNRQEPVLTYEAGTTVTVERSRAVVLAIKASLVLDGGGTVVPQLGMGDGS